MHLRPMFLNCVGIGGVILSVACTGTSTGNPADEPKDGLTLGDFGAASFRLIDAKAADCPEELEKSEGKLQPARAELEVALGTASAEFIVLMKEEVSLEEYPLPEGSRDRDSAAWAEDPVYTARARRIAESQACAVASLKERGGTYGESFLLVNAFVATLTVPEAVRLSERVDVRQVELSQSDAPPP